MAVLVYHWKHGWIPLTHAAALSKAHGSSHVADRYIRDASFHHGNMPTRGLSARRIQERLNPHSDIIGRDLSSLSDESLYAMMGRANDVEVDHLIVELDRRDKATRTARRARERRDATHRAKDDQFDQMVTAGHDAESAYAEVYGVSPERQRRNAAISTLRQNGFKGAGFDALTRDAYRDYLEQSYWDAEEATKGHFFRGKTNLMERRDSRRLFNGNEAYARANASEELLSYWQQHGRLTLEDFRAAMLGGQLKSKGRKAWL